MNKIILLLVSLFCFTHAALFCPQHTVKPEDIGALTGIQALSKQSPLKPSLIHPAAIVITHQKFREGIICTNLSKKRKIVQNEFHTKDYK